MLLYSSKCKIRFASCDKITFPKDMPYLNCAQVWVLFLLLLLLPDATIFFSEDKKAICFKLPEKRDSIRHLTFCCVRGMKVSSVSVNQIVNGMEPNKFLRNFLR